jgi:hypothetical protein
MLKPVTSYWFFSDYNAKTNANFVKNGVVSEILVKEVVFLYLVTGAQLLEPVL